MNPLYRGSRQQISGNPLNNMNAFIQQLNQFKRTFSGDPRQTVMNMLQSGQITQDQLNQVVQTANQLMQIMK